MMRRWIAAAAALLGLVWAAPAMAVCTLPYQLQNGKISDANQVMANFNAILSCVNTPSLQVTDGSTTVMGTTEIDFTSGAVVTMGAAGVADVAVSGGGTCSGSEGELLYTPTGSDCQGISDITTDGSATLIWGSSLRTDDPGDLINTVGFNMTISGGPLHISNSNDGIELNANGLLDFVTATGVEINGTSAVNCTGSPTSSFAAIDGIVTHC